MLGVAKIDKRIQAGHRLEDDIAALAAIAAVRAAIFDVLLAPERDRARAACARADEDLGLIEKVHGGSEQQTRHAGESRNPPLMADETLAGMAKHC
jgi:hypothetical protein